MIAACAMGAGAASAYPAQGQTDEGSADDAPLAVVETFFADVGVYEPACAELELFYDPAIVPGIPEASRAQFQQWRSEFAQQVAALENSRSELEGSANEFLFASLDVLRKLEAVWRASARQREASWFDWTGSWESAEPLYDLTQAEVRVQELMASYYLGLFRLMQGEEQLRTLARSYYGVYTGHFGVLDTAERERVIGAFRERMACIEIGRGELFAQQIAATPGFRETLQAWVTGGVDPADAGQGLTATGVAGDTVQTAGELAQSLVGVIQRERHYAWLAAETSTNASIFSSLLAAHDAGLRANELHEARIRDARANLEVRATDPLPGTDGDGIRLQILQLRAERGILAMYEKQLAAEAAYRMKVSAMLGLSQMFADAWRQLGVTAGGLSDNALMEGFEPHLRSLGLFAITQKMFAESAQLLITRPLQDAFTEYALKPVYSLWGDEPKTAADKERDRYETTKRDLDRRTTLLFEVWGASTIESALTFISAVRSGEPSAVGIGRQAPMTVRELMEDADFIAKTDGGLPWIFSIASRDLGDRNALLAWGAKYELEANNRLAAVRVAATRGLSVENPDLTLTRSSLDAILDPQGPDPTSFSNIAILVTDRTISLIPGIGPLRDVANLPQQVRNSIEYLKGNILGQDDYLRTRVAMQQQLLSVINALDTCDYQTDCLASRWPDIHADHIDLLNRSAEWASAVRRMRDFRTEREKVRAWARYAVDGKVPTAWGRATLADLQMIQDMDNADLLQRAAHLRLVDHALTVNYAAAALQITELEKAEQTRRATFGIKPAIIDLSGVKEIFEAEVVRNEMVQVYEGLYQTALKDIVMGVTKDFLVNSIMSGITESTGLRFAEAVADPLAARTQFLGKLNPWVGKFSGAGVYNTFKGAFEDSLKDAAAQEISKHQNMFTQQQVADAVDIIHTLVDGVAEGVRDRVDQGDVTWMLDRLEDAAREEVVERYTGELVAHAQGVRRLEEQLETVPEGPDADLQRAVLAGQIIELEANPDIRRRRASLATVMDDADEVIERRIQAEEESRLTGRRIAAGILEAEARNRQRAAPADSDAADVAARAADAAQFIGRMAGDEVTVEDLERLVAPDDPLSIQTRLLRPGMDIVVLRHALKAAEANNPAQAARIKEIARDIDNVRIETVNRLLRQFLGSRGHQVAIVIQGGAARGNPEYQGLFGDIDFTVFTAEGVDGDDLKRELLDYFTAQGFPLAEDTSEGRIEGHMDTEAFVQPWGRFDSGEEEFGDVLYDVGTKRKDPSRFYSEAGGKWFLNNAAYSGKVLWGDAADTSRWARVEPGEAYGLALDMTRYLGFLTDSDYASSAVSGLGDTAAQKARMTSVLKKTKYFIRLVDAYLISHEGLGNGLYNDVRLTRRPAGEEPEGEDASYHLQIYKDAEELLRAGSDAADPERATRARQSMLGQEDLRFIRWMADMKMKGVNPDPWETIDGATDEEKLANALALNEWMRTKGPQILAQTANVWMQSFQRTMAGGTPEERQRARADARRIGSTVLNVDEKDPYGAATMMRPPVIAEEAPDGTTRYRVMPQAQHEQQIRAHMRQAEATRARMKRSMDRVEAAIRAEYPADAYLTEQQREAVAARIRQMTQAVFDQEEPIPEQEAEVLEWFRFWSTR